jgi:hypothetical protein
MYARFTITMPIFIVGLTYFFIFSTAEFARGEVESREKSALTELGLSEIQILQVGEFFCEIAAEPNEVWLGLYPTKDGYSLMPSTVRVDAFYDPAMGDDENVTGATRVSVQGQNAPLFLITGLDSLKAGTVKTLFSGRLPLPLGSSLEFTLDNEITYSITAFGGLKSNSGSVDRKVELVKGNRSQVICSFDTKNATVSYLLWAGDIDRDGQLDLLIDSICDYSTSGPALFLSSLAEDGNLLQNAAQFETSPTPVLN